MTTRQLTVPDFDTYPVTNALTKAEVIDGGVRVVWDDGVDSRLPALWLREFSPDLATYHEVTREQMINLNDIPEDIRASEVSISGDGFLCVRWMPEGLESHYHPGWLRAYLPDTPTPVFDLPVRRLWDQEYIVQPRWFDGGAVRDRQTGEFKAWVEAIHVRGLGLLTGLPADPAIIPRIPEMIGSIRRSNFGLVFEVCSRKDTNTNANTALALAAHSDLATREYVPGLQFLFCMTNDATGGNSILVDGFAVAEQLKQESAEYYDLLSTVPVEFGTKDKHSDYRFSVPVLEHDRWGQLSTIRYTYWLRLPMRGDFDTIIKFYRAFRRFQEIANDPANQMSFRLKSGDMMAFDNRRILHGRSAFDPKSGNRLLLGCYSEREELESCLRILSRQERQNKSKG